jgi:hypothetical protein
MARDLYFNFVRLSVSSEIDLNRRSKNHSDEMYRRLANQFTFVNFASPGKESTRGFFTFSFSKA